MSDDSSTMPAKANCVGEVVQIRPDEVVVRITMADRPFHLVYAPDTFAEPPDLRDQVVFGVRYDESGAVVEPVGVIPWQPDLTGEPTGPELAEYWKDRSVWQDDGCREDGQ